MSTTHRDAAEISNYERAELLIARNTGPVDLDIMQANLALAQVAATLAQVDAIDRLTAVLECMELPALEVSGSVLKGTCRVRPVRR